MYEFNDCYSLALDILVTCVGIAHGLLTCYQSLLSIVSVMHKGELFLRFYIIM